MWCIWYELKHTHEYKARERDFHNMSGINFISINLIEELIRFEWHTKMCVLFYFPFMMDLNKILHETRRLVFYACILIIKKNMVITFFIHLLLSMVIMIITCAFLENVCSQWDTIFTRVLGKGLYMC